MESVPPRLYGGTERIVSCLTEELVRLGHDVTRFASGDSITAADLIPSVPKALRFDTNVIDPIPYYLLRLERVRQCADDFDRRSYGGPAERAAADRLPRIARQSDRPSDRPQMAARTGHA
jgi:hypothetical protein